MHDLVVKREGKASQFARFKAAVRAQTNCSVSLQRTREATLNKLRHFTLGSLVVFPFLKPVDRIQSITFHQLFERLGKGFRFSKCIHPHDFAVDEEHRPYRGKSGLLKCLVAAAIRAGISARYARSADILSEIRSSYGDDASTTEADITSTYGSIALLAVDEVGRIGSTAWAQSTMMTLLDTRYNRRDSLATVLATNLEPHQFPDYLVYLASRLKDGDRVMVAGKDLRG